MDHRFGITNPHISELRQQLFNAQAFEAMSNNEQAEDYYRSLDYLIRFGKSDPELQSFFETKLLSLTDIKAAPSSSNKLPQSLKIGLANIFAQVKYSLRAYFSQLVMEFLSKLNLK